MLTLVWLACTPSLECGPGTAEADGLCVPTEDTDTDVVDTDVEDTDVEPTPIDVYLLAGQSNMDGYGYISGLPPEWQTADPNVPLYWSGWAQFRRLAPASYGGALVTGPEVGLGRALAEGGREIALVKHAVGGTDLAAFWNPGTSNEDPTIGAGWAGLIATIDGAEAALNADGRPWRWAGFAWMQGESDATYEPYANAYADNLSHLIARVREETAAPELPIVIGLISTEPYWVYSDVVRAAETAVGAADAQVFVVETDDLPRNPQDLAHYDGVSERVMGTRFATAFLEARDVGPGPDAPAPAMTVTSWATDFDFTGTCGWSFHLDQPVTVTDVGIFGPTNWLYTSSDLGVWDADGNLVLRANVPGLYDFPATWRGGFWYIAVDPQTLPAGDYRIAQVQWAGDADRYANDAVGTMADGVAFGAGVYVESYWLAYPSNVGVTEGFSFVGPNLLFVPAE